MTDEQIIKALACCKYSVNNKDCGCCPYVECETQIGCVGELLTNTLDLIKRQRAEIAELKSDLRLKTNDYNHLKEECEKIQKVSSDRKDRLMNTVVNLKDAQLVNKELIEDNAGLNETILNLLEQIKTIKSEVIKEFAERLKALPSVMNCEYEWLHIDIDNLVKEMESDKNV